VIVPEGKRPAGSNTPAATATCWGSVAQILTRGRARSKQEAAKKVAQRHRFNRWLNRQPTKRRWMFKDKHALENLAQNPSPSSKLKFDELQSKLSRSSILCAPTPATIREKSLLPLGELQLKITAAGGAMAGARKCCARELANN